MVTFRSDRVLLPGGFRPATIRAEEGIIVEVSDAGGADYDFGERAVLPGLVDSHVHINEPGRADWEGFSSATRAAAAGGTTTLVDMPLNSIPPTVSVGALDEKRAAAEGKLSVDVAFWGGIIPGSEPDIEPLVDAGVCGFKAFMVDSGVPEFPPMDLDGLAQVTPLLGALGVPLLVHAEDGAHLRSFEGDSRRYQGYLESRPVMSEVTAVESLIPLAAGATRVHVLHISSADAAVRIGGGPANLTGETCPHYLTFAADEVPDGATPFKCAPPIRESSHREGLWEALINGDLTVVVSDHSPAPAELKAVESGDFAAAWGGVGSLQLRLPIVWTGAAARGVPLERLAEWLALEPARLAGLSRHKGSIAVGKDADLVVFDQDGESVVEGSALQHRHPITPYDGMRLRGEVVTTILRGQMVYDDGTITSGLGRKVLRDD